MQRVGGGGAQPARRELPQTLPHALPHALPQAGCALASRRTAQGHALLLGAQPQLRQGACHAAHPLRLRRRLRRRFRRRLGARLVAQRHPVGRRRAHREHEARQARRLLGSSPTLLPCSSSLFCSFLWSAFRRWGGLK